MVIGGKREGAGRKSSWRSPTKMMRLPAKYESQIVDYARRLDSESESSDQAALLVHIDAVLLSIRPSERKVAGRLFKKLMERL